MPRTTRGEQSPAEPTLRRRDLLKGAAGATLLVGTAGLAAAQDDGEHDNLDVPTEWRG
jgi:hypothetical protein